MKKKTRLVSIFLFIILILSIDTSLPQEVKYTRTNDVVYGRKDGMALTMDVFQPEKPNGIGVILLISGGWNSRYSEIDKSWLANIKKLVEANETVFAVVHSSMPKYKIPDIQKDIERAVRYIRFNASGWKINGDKIAIMGHSSGGHLSILHASTAKEGDNNSKDPVDRVSAKINAVACFYPPTDFLYFGGKGINVFSNPRFQRFLPAFIDDVKDTIQLVKIAGEVSPVNYISSSMPPTIIISGNADKLVPFQQTQLLFDKLNELKVPCRLEVKEGKDHGWPDMVSDYKYVINWFEKYLLK